MECFYITGDFDYIARIYTVCLCEKALHLGDTVKKTVITAVKSTVGEAIISGHIHVHKPLADIKLLRIGLTS